MSKGTLLLLILASAAVVAILSSWQYAGISIPNASAVTADSGIGVYWDQAATNSCRSIYWGWLTPGTSKSLVVYLKNERYEPMFYSVTTNQWNPINASQYMALYSDYYGGQANPGSVIPVSLTLSVSDDIFGISDFSFDIIIKGDSGPLGDANHDGKVDVLDVIIVSTAYGSSPGDPTWNANADLNGDGKVDGLDIDIVKSSYGTITR